MRTAESMVNPIAKTTDVPNMVMIMIWILRLLEKRCHTRMTRMAVVKDEIELSRDHYMNRTLDDGYGD